MNFFKTLDEQVRIVFEDIENQPPEFKEQLIDVFKHTCHNLKFSSLTYFLETNEHTRSMDVSKFMYSLIKIFLWAYGIGVRQTSSSPIACIGCNGGCQGLLFVDSQDHSRELFAFVFRYEDDKLTSIIQCKSFTKESPSKHLN